MLVAPATRSAGHRHCPRAPGRPQGVVERLPFAPFGFRGLKPSWTITTRVLGPKAACSRWCKKTCSLWVGSDGDAVRRCSCFCCWSERGERTCGVISCCDDGTRRWIERKVGKPGVGKPEFLVELDIWLPPNQPQSQSPTACGRTPDPDPAGATSTARLTGSTHRLVRSESMS